MKTRRYLFWGLLIATGILHAQCTKDDENGNGGGNGNGNGGGPYISYGDYGAVGDGLTDDFAAIVRAHEAANMMGWPVRAVSGKTYRIGDSDKTAIIKTDTDWGDAKFIIDDSQVGGGTGDNYGKHIFTVSPTLPSQSISSVSSLKRDQETIGLKLEYGAVIVATDKNVKRYIRSGNNVNSGSDQTDVFVIDKNGSVDMNAPIIWDFNQVTSMTAYPIDDKTLTIKGGNFTTIANRATTNVYYARNLYVERSNVVVDGVQHRMAEEGAHVSPYNGFIYVSNCANVTVQNCKLSGRKSYQKTGNSGSTVTMGTYGMGANRAINLKVKDCTQLNDINDNTYWGLFASNFSKNIVLDGVSFSRFDAHQGVANVTIQNSTLGHQSCNLIGSGTALIENTKICGSRFVNLRNDYGSTWEGELIIRNCEFYPSNGTGTNALLIDGSNNGQWNYGYTCYMPETVTLENLIIDDSKITSGSYKGPKIFNDFNSSWTGTEPYPYVITKKLIIKNLTIKSGKPYQISTNTKGMFDSMVVLEE